MTYHLEFTDKAQKDISIHKKSGNKAILKKLFILLKEVEKHPFSGKGKPEPFKYDLWECDLEE